MSSTETVKSLVRHVVEEVAHGNLDILQEHPGLCETIPFHRALNEAFSERKVTFTLQFTDGEWVASRIIVSQLHTGMFIGIAPTHKRVEHEVLLLHRVVAGKIVQEHAQADVGAAMAQIGMPIGKVAVASEEGNIHN
jgi:predicted ester cyclase